MMHLSVCGAAAEVGFIKTVRQKFERGGGGEGGVGYVGCLLKAEGIYLHPDSSANKSRSLRGLCVCVLAGAH